MKRILLFLALLFLSIGLGLIPGCSDSTAPEDGTGRVVLTLIDAPGDYEAINLMVVGVECHMADMDSNAGWLTLSADTTRVDLLTLTNGESVELADDMLDAGRYTQFRLLLGDSNTIVVDGETHDLTVPSGSTSGLKLNHAFEILDGGEYAFTLDFDADRSVHVTGNDRYTLKPVIRLLVDALSGSVRGVVLPPEARAMIRTVAGADTVTAYADTLTGQFRNMMLPAGSYDIDLLPTADGYRDSTISGVEVEAGGVTNLGPITLTES